MKKCLPTLLALLLCVTAYSQLVLQRAFTPTSGKHYLQLVNSNTAAVSMGCYSIVSFYRSGGEEGFYLFQLPKNQLGGEGLLTISSTEPFSYNSVTNHLNLSLPEMAQQGLMQKYVFNGVARSFQSSGLESGTPFRFIPGENVNDHLVLLYQGGTLVDASAQLDAQGKLSSFFKSMPDLKFENSCGDPVSVRFGAIEELYPKLFNIGADDTAPGYFSEFEIRRNSAQVQIAWQTIRERGNRGFQVERRSEQQPWTTIGYVASLAPAGNSDKALRYLYTDQIMPGAIQYRLKQIDNMGRTSYSPVKLLNAYGEEESVVAFPNPSVDGRVKLSFQAVNVPRDIQVMDMNGQLIQRLYTNNTGTIQLQDLRPGSYVIRIIDQQSGNVRTERIIVRN